MKDEQQPDLARTSVIEQIKRIRNERRVPLKEARRIWEAERAATENGDQPDLTALAERIAKQFCGDCISTPCPYCARLKRYGMALLTEAVQGYVRSWKCFHCDEVFTDEADAREHFGLHESDQPGCVAKLTTDEKTLLHRLNVAESDAALANEKLDYAEQRLAMQESDIRHRFKGRTTIEGAWQEFDSMEGRALAAEERAEAAEQREQALRDENARLNAESESRRQTLFKVREEQRAEWIRAENAECALQALRDGLRKTREVFIAARDHLRSRHGCDNFDDFDVETCEWPTDPMSDNGNVDALLTAPAVSVPVKTRCPYDQAQCEWSRCLEKDPQCQELNPQPAAPAGPRERASIAEIRQRATDFAEGYRAGYADGLEGDATDSETAWARSKASAELERQNRPVATPGQEPKA